MKGRLLIAIVYFTKILFLRRNFCSIGGMGGGEGSVGVIIFHPAFLLPPLYLYSKMHFEFRICLECWWKGIGTKAPRPYAQLSSLTTKNMKKVNCKDKSFIFQAIQDLICDVGLIPIMTEYFIILHDN